MGDPISTLGKKATTMDTGSRVSATIREFAKLYGSAPRESDPLRRERELLELASHAASQSDFDPLMCAFADLMAATGDSDTFRPGENAGVLFGAIGTTKDSPSAADSLRELLFLTVRDFIALHTAAMTKTRATVSAEGEEVAARERARADALAADVKRLENELEASEQENREKSRKLELLMGGAAAPAEGTDEAGTDWKAVPDHPNLDYRLNARSETAYRARWRDGGPQQKKVLGVVSLEEACKLRDELMNKETVAA